MQIKFIITSFLVGLIFFSYAQANLDFKYSQFFGNNSSKEITSYLANADNFITNDKYDSAQFWLNKVFTTKNPYTISVQNCYTLSRQAEILYYNNIHLMGEETSRRALDIALTLNDSLLIADSYNFIGLFLSNMDSAEKAIPYFKKAISYFKNVPQGSFYEKLTRPLHTFGDMAETFDKMQIPDSAIHYAFISLKKAIEINRLRGEAVALQIIAKSYDKKIMPDSSKKYYEQSVKIANLANESDVALIGKVGLAKSYLDLQLKFKANELIDSSISFLNLHPEINILYAKDFFTQVLKIYKISANTDGIIKAENKILFFDSIINKKNVSQMQTVFKNLASVENQLLNTEINELKQTNRVRISMFFLALICLLSIFVISRAVKQKKIQSNNAINKERERIITDLHDDVGATLSSMHIYGDLANTVWDTQPQQSKDMVGKIAKQSKELMNRMSDIVWSLKPAGEEKNSFTGRLKNYCADLLTGKNIVAVFAIDETLVAKVVNPLARKNLLLITKEAINNIAKYSKATNVNITFKQQEQYVLLTISDNGKGFNKSLVSNGNGLGNIEQRCKQLSGNCTIETSEGKGVTITCSFPIAIISHTG